MKYGDKSTFKGKQRKKHGSTVKPAMIRYFQSLRWLTNKQRNIKKEEAK
jgi:hypothetical protein